MELTRSEQDGGQRHLSFQSSKAKPRGQPLTVGSRVWRPMAFHRGPDSAGPSWISWPSPAVRSSGSDELSQECGGPCPPW